MHITVPQRSPSASAHPSPIPGDSPYLELGDMSSPEIKRYEGHKPAPIDMARLEEFRPVEEEEKSTGDKIQDFLTNWWLIELTAWVLSAFALAAIVALLATCDNKPLPRWPMSITLNSFVSILATIMKACLVVPVAEGISQLKWLWFKKAGILQDIQTFDEASRGLFGSMKLLLSTRGVHLAKLGALLSVIVLAIDPFVQQIVTYPSRTVPGAIHNATIPVATGYDGYAPGGIMGTKDPTLAIKAAVYSGLYGSDMTGNGGSDFAVTPFCSTGNCTWEAPYSSLAMCTKCANITESLKSNCSGSLIPDRCNYTLPSGLTLGGQFIGGNAFMESNAYGEPSSVHFNGTSGIIASVQTIRGLHDLSAQSLLGAVANECILYPCVNTYRASVVGGNFSEHKIATVEPTHGELTDGGFSSNGITLHVANDETNYTLATYSIQGLQFFFDNIFRGSVQGATGRESGTSDTVRALYDMGTSKFGDGTPTKGDNTTMEAIADSITKLLRTGKGLEYNQTAAAGGSSITETYVHVRWEWITLPIAVEVLALLFLVGTIVRSKTSGVAVWKSSTLPLLHCRIVDEDQHGAQSAAASGGFSPGTPMTPYAREGVTSSWGSGKLHELNRWAMSSEVRLQRSETGASEFVTKRRDVRE
ncbi:uncharacterized protein K452DRAFT_292425 [Aplosporella prunicola CBS 121167]|uniref:Uncharacterized protein n=1 Tax=Aplosporella prunicola CBS 121167 TaxID=1176127 RepID=A0A6A6AWL6_9PEZI|nr:uncharacterized protein K452DRAFT_292425 [Aplosporella prunicola CBS 121167]KAF2136392.1 hypothetical protein K452DRAFT_292425 [Aplosporella prunicola CBS 121167]